jgi:hypothetical protein
MIAQYFGTVPNLDVRDVLPALFLTIGRLYQEAWLRQIIKDKNIRVIYKCQ